MSVQPIEASPPPRASQREPSYQRRAISEPSPTPFKPISYAPLPHEKTPHPPAGSRLSSMNRSRASRLSNGEVRAPSVDIANPSISQVRAVTSVACAWRGFFVRRELRNARITEQFRRKYLIKMQCFVRCWKARQIAKAKKAILEARREAIVDRYSEERLKAIGPVVQWQRRLFEDAATTVQRVWRWRVKYDREGPEAAGDFPLAGSHPLAKGAIAASIEASIRDDHSAAGNEDRGLLSAGSSAITSPIAASKQLVVVPEWKKKEQDQPMLGVVPEDEVYAANEAMRRREQHNAYVREDRIAIRQPENEMAIVSMDMQGCAAMVQRQFRIFAAKNELSSRKTLSEYLNKHASVAQRAIRTHTARVRHQRLIAGGRAAMARKNELYAIEMVKRIEADYAWNRHTMDMAALCIQKLWHHYVHMQRLPEDRVPREWAAEGPPPPPYGLLEGTRSPTRKSKRKAEAKAKKEKAEATQAQDAAALKIQCAMRQSLARKEVAERRERKAAEREEAAKRKKEEDEKREKEEAEQREREEAAEKEAAKQREEEEAAKKEEAEKREREEAEQREKEEAEKREKEEAEAAQKRAKEDAAALQIQNAMRQREAQRAVAERRKAREAAAAK